jgi:hypothetical protein
VVKFTTDTKVKSLNKVTKLSIQFFCWNLLLTATSAITGMEMVLQNWPSMGGFLLVALAIAIKIANIGAKIVKEAKK